jgi:titin
MPRTTLGFPRSSVSAPRARARQRDRRSRPGFDALEERQLLSGVFTVSNTNDSGPGSLRAAILASNASPIVSPPTNSPVVVPATAPMNLAVNSGSSNSGGPTSGTTNQATPSSATAPFSIIEFNLPAGSTIAPLSPLPAITVPVETFAPINFSATGTVIPTITISGAQAGQGTVGLDIQTSGANITDLAIDGFSGGGVLFDGAAATYNTLSGDSIGVSLTGSGGGGGNGTYGVEARSGASFNQIYGDTIAASGGNGVVLTGAGTSNNLIQTDRIGTDPTGSFALGNGGSGVVINGGASNNTLNGDLISGNGYYGVYISDAGTSSNVVTNSWIGTNAAGTAAISNGATGVYILNSATNNTVGTGDVISGNAADGVAIAGSGTTGNVVEGDYIGTNASGTAALGIQYTGVYLLAGASSNQIGGTTAATRDVIAGNVYNGVYITGSGTSYNLVVGDFIGTDSSGSYAVGQQSGVVLAGGASSNDIGTMQTSAGDVISGNGTGVEITDSGTMSNWVENDLIGTNAGDTYAVANSTGVLIQRGASYNGVYSNVISGNAVGVEIVGANTADNYVYFNEIGTNQSGSIAIGNLYYGVYVWQASGNVIVYNTIEFSGYYGLVNGYASNSYYYNNVVNNGYGNVVMF